MNITKELRRVAVKTECASGRCEKLYRGDLERIADRIDAEHERVCRDLTIGAEPMTDERMAEHGWVRLPRDADGEPIRIGELMDERLPFGGYAKPAPVDEMELYRNSNGSYGWLVKLDAENRAFISPKLLRHYHEPTVEDVLREFAQEMAENLGMYTSEAIDADEWHDADAKTIAEYAAKLRLAGDAE